METESRWKKVQESGDYVTVKGDPGITFSQVYVNAESIFLIRIFSNRKLTDSLTHALRPARFA